MTSTVKIFEHALNGANWIVESQGNGLSYVLKMIPFEGPMKECFFQGDDATAFRDEFDSAFVIGKAHMIEHVFYEYMAGVQS